MDKEKILYHAKHNNGFTIRACEYQGKWSDNLDYLIHHKMLNWVTSGLWSEYESCGQTDLYDQALHEYKITPDGEVLLSLFRLAYAHKNHLNEEKHFRRIDEFYQLLDACGKESQYFEQFLTKNQKKALVYARQVRELPDDSAMLVEPELNSSMDLNPHKIAHFHLGIPKERIEAIDLELPQLLSMFNMSVGLGPLKTNKTRTEEYVLRKINEELGEMTLEMNIADGLSYKSPGKDGVKGEAVDLAICALDMFALQCPGMNAEQIEREFLTYMLIKLNKWRDTLE